MNLLDLPLEIFYYVVYHYIMMHGVEGARKLLLICKVFYMAITYDLLPRMPLKVFYTSSGRKFFDQYFSRILQARLMQVHRREKLHDLHSFLPKYINRISNAIYEISGEVSYTDRCSHEATLCDTMLMNFGPSRDVSRAGLIYLMLYKSNRKTNKGLIEKFNQTFRYATIAAAVAIGDVVALEELIKPFHGNMWQHSSAFGTPFYAAVVVGSTSLVGRALDNLKTFTLPLPEAIRNILVGSMETSLDKGYVQIAKDVLNLGPDYIPEITATTFKCWFNKALATGDLEIMEAILKLRPSKRCLVKVFIAACKTGHVGSMSLFFGPDLLDINEYFGASAFVGLYGYPLEMAIYNATSDQSSVRLVEHLLSIGASPNGPNVAWKCLSMVPLVKAVEKHYWDTVKFLLEHAADLNMPAAPMGMWKEKFDVLKAIEDFFGTKPQHTLSRETWNILRELLMFGSGYQVATAFLPQPGFNVQAFLSFYGTAGLPLPGAPY